LISKPRIIELVGPPGAGKTTFARTTALINPDVTIAPIPYFRETKYLLFFVRNTLRLLPTFLRIPRGADDRWLTRREVALMVMLSGWPAVLDDELNSNGNTLILDEGPVCFLSRLHAFGSTAMKGSGTARWWQQMFQVWSRKLDGIIRLDLPDAVLVERIRARDLPQEIKEMPDEAAFQYLQRLRAAQDYLLAALAAESKGPAVFQYDLRRTSPDRIRTQVTTALGL
jgi:hypothetical protein